MIGRGRFVRHAQWPSGVTIPLTKDRPAPLTG
jgi:hypothetical protein